MSWASLKDVTNRLAHAVAAFHLPPPPATAEVAPTSTSSDPQAVSLASVDPAPPGPSLATLPALVNGFDCPGDCPPPTVNILCQPHPDQARFTNRIIVKFSSIDEPTLNNALHITPQSVADLGNDDQVVGANIAHQLRLYVASITPPPDPAFVGAGKVAQVMAVMNEGFDAMERVFGQALASSLGAGSASAFYGVIRDKVYEGAPCPDCTLKVTGTVTHVAVSSFLSGTVGATLSTAGTLGLVGNVNVLGARCTVFHSGSLYNFFSSAPVQSPKSHSSSPLSIHGFS